MNLQPVLAYPRVLLSLSRFLRRPIDFEESRVLIRRRMETREARFLASVARHTHRETLRGRRDVGFSGPGLDLVPELGRSPRHPLAAAQLLIPANGAVGRYFMALP